MMNIELLKEFLQACARPFDPYAIDGWLENIVFHSIAMYEGDDESAKQGLVGIILDNLYKRDAQRSREKYLSQWVKKAIINENIKALRYFLSYQPINECYKIDIECPMSSPDVAETPLSYVCFEYVDSNLRLETARVLLESGANPNVLDFAGDTPLHRATYRNDPSLIELLLAYHANPNQVNKLTKISSFEYLLERIPSNISEPMRKHYEDSVLPCVPVFLKYNANTYCHFYRDAQELNFTRVLKLVDDTRSYPTHILATYAKKKAMSYELKNLPYNRFQLEDALGRTPSSIAEKLNADPEVAKILANYEAVYMRNQLMQTNYECSGQELPLAIGLMRSNTSSFLTSQEFTAFTTATNMHFKREQTPEKEKNTEEVRSTTNSRYRLFSSLEQNSQTKQDEVNNDNEQQPLVKSQKI